ncbi:MAG: porin [Deltaproteobacteria bacterium]
MKNALILVVFLMLSIQCFAIRDTLFIPEIEGTIRAKYEYATGVSEQRFQVRNARFSVNGYLSKITSYKAEIDLSDEGVTKMLDAYIKVKLSNKLSFTAGQQKVPFSTDNLRSPHQLYFANRSFIGKQLTGLRDVGFSTDYKGFKGIDFSIGIFNGTGLYNQKQWRSFSEMSYVARAVFNPFSILKISLNYNSIQPTGLRMDLFDAGVILDINNLHVESEYYYKTYQDTILEPTQGFFGFIAYDFVFKNSKHLKKITPLIRYDLMTANLRFDEAGKEKYDPAKKRITSGLTFSLNKPFLNDIKLNFEKYFVEEGQSDPDSKIVIELSVRF